MDRYNEPGPINVGCGEDISIRELALLIKSVVGYEGELFFDISKPDGTPRKLMDISKIRNLGLEANIELKSGIRKFIKS